MWCLHHKKHPVPALSSARSLTPGPRPAPRASLCTHARLRRPVFRICEGWPVSCTIKDKLGVSERPAPGLLTTGPRLLPRASLSCLHHKKHPVPAPSETSARSLTPGPRPPPRVSLCTHARLLRPVFRICEGCPVRRSSRPAHLWSQNLTQILVSTRLRCTTSEGPWLNPDLVGKWSPSPAKALPFLTQDQANPKFFLSFHKPRLTPS